MVSRRNTIRLLAAGGLLGTSGCASVAQQIDDRDRPSSPTGTTNGSDVRSTTATSTDGTTDGASDDTTGQTTSSAEYDAAAPTGYLTDVPVPDSPSEFTYARMGRADAPTVTFYGNWKCPYTREFVLQDLPGLAREYVGTGRVAIRFRALAYQDGQPYLGPDAPRAAWAGLAVWAHDPGSFWSYLATVFQNQPPERDEWATRGQIRAFLRTAGVEKRDAILEDVHTGARDDTVRDTTDAARKHDIRTVPRLVHEDTVVAPNLEPDATRDLLERAATGGSMGDGNEGIGNGGEGADGGDDEE